MVLHCPCLFASRAHRELLYTPLSLFNLSTSPCSLLSNKSTFYFIEKTVPIRRELAHFPEKKKKKLSMTPSGLEVNIIALWMTQMHTRYESITLFFSHFISDSFPFSPLKTSLMFHENRRHVMKQISGSFAWKMSRCKSCQMPPPQRGPPWPSCFQWMPRTHTVHFSLTCQCLPIDLASLKQRY